MITSFQPQTDQKAFTTSNIVNLFFHRLLLNIESFDGSQHSISFPVILFAMSLWILAATINIKYVLLSLLTLLAFFFSLESLPLLSCQCIIVFNNEMLPGTSFLKILNKSYNSLNLLYFDLIRVFLLSDQRPDPHISDLLGFGFELIISAIIDHKYKPRVSVGIRLYFIYLVEIDLVLCFSRALIYVPVELTLLQPKIATIILRCLGDDHYRLHHLDNFIFCLLG